MGIPQSRYNLLVATIYLNQFLQIGLISRDATLIGGQQKRTKRTGFTEPSQPLTVTYDHRLNMTSFVRVFPSRMILFNFYLFK